MNIFLLSLKAIIFGFITGFIASIPLGPAGIESIKRTILKGFREGYKVSLGALSADLVYLFLINCGLSNVLSSNKETESLFWVISGVILILIGYTSNKHHNGDETIFSKITKSANISSLPFLTGFLITSTNPMTPTLWITLSGTVIRAWYYINRLCYYIFIVSIMAGMAAWFALLNYLAYKGFNFIPSHASNKTAKFLMWGIVGSGLLFIGYGFYFFLIHRT